MIEVDQISKYFGPIPAVREVTFRVNPGEILGFLGPNGAGKTTTMRILTGFYPPTNGSVRVAGLDVFESPLAVRKKIGYLPENVPLYGEMTVRDFLFFVADLKGVEKNKRQGAVGRAMEVCRIEAVAGRYIKKLSKGFRQRVGLAQALVGDPEILILDEPTIGLDPRQINEIRSLIKSFAGEKTVILSTHILPEVSMTCQRVVIINQGVVVAEDTPENLSAQLGGGDRIKVRIGGPYGRVRSALKGLPGVRAVTSVDGAGTYLLEAEEEIRPQLAMVVCSSGWDLYEMVQVSATLEDVFLNLVTEEKTEVQDDA